MKKLPPITLVTFLFTAICTISFIPKSNAANAIFPIGEGGDTIINTKPIIKWPSNPHKTPAQYPMVVAIHYGNEIVISSTWASGLDYEISNEEGVQLSGILYCDNDSINVSNLSPGMYTLQLSTENYEVSGTFYK